MAFAAFSGLIATAVAADQLALQNGRVIAFVLPHLVAKIALHMAVCAAMGPIFIDRIAIITDQHGSSIYRRRKNDARSPLKRW